jgi:hypothetical protein
MCGCVAGGDYESVTPAVVVVGKECVDSVDQARGVISFKDELCNICHNISIRIPSPSLTLSSLELPPIQTMGTYSSCYNSDYKPPQS